MCIFEYKWTNVADHRELEASFEDELGGGGVLKAGREVIFGGATSVHCGSSFPGVW